MSALTSTRVLIVDDQPDVAQTLCASLKQEGASLFFAPDGEEAYKRVESEPFDLVIIDLKMPPGDWGGIWLLEILRREGWKFPTVVLSQEGTKTQTIEALRLGASDWIDKSPTAAKELQDRCMAIIDRANSEALEAAAMRLPSLLAHAIIDYSRAAYNERAVAGVRLLEAILRFTAILGLCTSPQVPIRGLRQQIVRPSMGTWFNVCTNLALVDGAGKTFLYLTECLMPDSKTRHSIQRHIRMRNAMYHRGYRPSAEEIDNLHRILLAFARRAYMTWRSILATPVSMTYDGKVFTISVKSLVGVNAPRSDEIALRRQVRTGQPILIDAHSNVASMFPWIVSDPRASAEKIVVFDGVKLRRSDQLRDDAPLVYFDPESGEGEIGFHGRQDLIWSAIAAWAETG